MSCTLCQYVPKELLPVYRDKIIPMADVITPNQFETESVTITFIKIIDLHLFVYRILTGITIHNDSDAIKAIDALHDKGIPTVVISSSDLSKNDNELVAIASSRTNGSRQLVKLLIPKLRATFIGTGDLFAALFMAWFTRTNRDLKTSCEKTVSTLQAILHKTYDFATKQTSGTSLPKNIELRLIQNRNELEEPKNTFKAIDLNEVNGF